MNGFSYMSGMKTLDRFQKIERYLIALHSKRRARSLWADSLLIASKKGGIVARNL